MIVIVSFLISIDFYFLVVKRRVSKSANAEGLQKKKNEGLLNLLCVPGQDFRQLTHGGLVNLPVCGWREYLS